MKYSHLFYRGVVMGLCLCCLGVSCAPKAAKVSHGLEVTVFPGPYGFPKVPSTYEHDGWKYTMSYSPNGRHYAIKLSYRGTKLDGKTYDRMTTPWGQVLRLYGDDWIYTGWVSLAIGELTKGRDMTPAAALPIRRSPRPTTKDTVSDCVAALRSDNSSVRWGAIGLLATLGPDNKMAVPALVKLLDKSRQSEIVQLSNIIGTLGRIGPNARDALPTLLKFREHKNPNVRSALVWALFRVDPKGARTKEYLTTSTKERDVRVQRAAAAALRDLQEMLRHKR